MLERRGPERKQETKYLKKVSADFPNLFFSPLDHIIPQNISTYLTVQAKSKLQKSMKPQLL